MKSNILVGIPTLNESGNIEFLVESLLSCPFEIDILVVDDGSTDGSEAFLQKLQNDGVVYLIDRGSRLGVGSAHKEMISYACQNDYEFLLTMDADGTHSVEDLTKLLKFQSMFDLLIGSRFMKGGDLIGWPIYRQVTTWTAHILNRIATGRNIDCTSGFRLYSLKRRDFLPLTQNFANDYSFFYQTAYWSIQNNVDIQQVPVSLKNRSKGSSKMGVSNGWRLGLQMTKDSLKLLSIRIFL